MCIDCMIFFVKRELFLSVFLWGYFVSWLFNLRSAFTSLAWFVLRRLGWSSKSLSKRFFFLWGHFYFMRQVVWVLQLWKFFLNKLIDFLNVLNFSSFGTLFLSEWLTCSYNVRIGWWEMTTSRFSCYFWLLMCHYVHLIWISSIIPLLTSVAWLWKNCFSSFFKVNFRPKSIFVDRRPFVDFCVRVSFFMLHYSSITSLSHVSQSSFHFRFWLRLYLSVNWLWLLLFKRSHLDYHLAWSVWGQ